MGCVVLNYARCFIELEKLTNRHESAQCDFSYKEKLPISARVCEMCMLRTKISLSIYMCVVSEYVTGVM